MTIDQQFEIGIAHHQANRLAEAEQIYRRILAQQPNHADALHLLGLLAGQAGHGNESINLIRRAIAIYPNSAIYFNNLGNVLTAMGKTDEALAACREAVRLAPDLAEAHNNLGNALKDKDQLDDAAGSYRESIRLKADLVESHNNLGNVLRSLGKTDEAIQSFGEALRLRPDYPDALSNLGNLLVETGKIDEGMALIRRAIQLKADFADAHYNLANGLQEASRFDEAIAEYDAAIRLKPDYAYAHFNRALSLLLVGRFAEGWAEYEWRTRAEPRLSLVPGSISQPRWRGEDLAGRTILLHAEQGFGDTIQMVRYVSRISKSAARVVLCCQKELGRLLKNFPGIDQIAAPGERMPEFDVHCPLMSLPGMFLTELNSIPAEVPYLAADAGDVAKWKSKLDGLPASLKVGLVWAGNKTHLRDRMRSMDPSLLDSLADLAGIQWISLQKGDVAGPGKIQLIDWTAEIHDFADTAALVANLDLVIAVDTAVAHLAGAMGKKVWVLLADPPDWRWMLDREDSPWYSMMRLFRQKSRGDWDGVMRELRQSLKDILS